ncbi:MAG: 16S rRNA (cytosine(1402)-N(4))-methyltransferase RsmH [Staphylococcus sp.]|nr:16S rRNA (cytosine(1402)-N(4))-methyltransferase RsmH [Staphylococcus sp.]
MKHISVLLNEAVEALNLRKDGLYVDCTLGGGGHSSLILSKIPNGHLFAFDQDAYAIDVAREKLSLVADNFTIINSNFSNIKEVLNQRGVSGVDGILYDLGVSSFQIDLPERGFSYRLDGPLDMRMNQNQTLDAYTIVNTYNEERLKKLLYEYGEERYAPLIAKKIAIEREKKPITSTLELVDIIKKAVPANYLRLGHPAKQTFQAIRIEVNNELGILRKSLENGLTMLNRGGRMVVISFHSLEDRIVKKLFKEKTTLNLPKGLPFIPSGYDIEFELVNHKIIIPSDDELTTNTRSHSAKMRVIQKK